MAMLKSSKSTLIFEGSKMHFWTIFFLDVFWNWVNDAGISDWVDIIKVGQNKMVKNQTSYSPSPQKVLMESFKGEKK